MDGMVSYPQDQSQKPRARAPALHTKPISTLAGETPALLTSSRWCFRSSCTCSNRGIGGCACKNTRSRKTPRRRTPTSEGTPLRSHPPRKNELRNTYRVITTLLWLFSHSRPRALSMTYNHPKRDNCDHWSHTVPTVRTLLPAQVFHVEHCTYTRRENCPQLHPLVLPQFMHL